LENFSKIKRSSLEAARILSSHVRRKFTQKKNNKERALMMPIINAWSRSASWEKLFAMN